MQALIRQTPGCDFIDSMFRLTYLHYIAASSHGPTNNGNLETIIRPAPTTILIKPLQQHITPCHESRMSDYGVAIMLEELFSQPHSNRQRNLENVIALNQPTNGGPGPADYGVSRYRSARRRKADSPLSNFRISARTVHRSRPPSVATFMRGCWSLISRSITWTCSKSAKTTTFCLCVAKIDATRYRNVPAARP